MLARLTIKTIWAGICAITGLVLSASSYADYLYKGHYYKNRQDGSVYQVPARHKNHRRKHRKYRLHRPHRPHRPHRLHGHPIAPHRPAHKNLKHSPAPVGGRRFQNNHGKFQGLKGHRVEGVGRSGSNPGSRPGVISGKERHFGQKNFSQQIPTKHYKKACKSVDDAIWAAQRIYPGGRIISAKPIIDRTGRRTSVEIRIMYRGSVKLINERC